MLDFKKYIRESIKTINDIEGEINVVSPPNEKMGDLSVACYSLKINNINNPADKAKFILDNLIIDNKIISKVSIIGPYINFIINREKLAEVTLNTILDKNELYGSSMKGFGNKFLIEHTSINPNASPHIGRSRNSIIGNFLVNLYKFEGYDVETHYFINDIGKQIAMLLIGVENMNNLDTVSFDEMLALYVKINDLSMTDKNVEKKVFKLLNELENGNEEVRRKFKQITDICVEGQKRIFDKMNIKWDKFTHESDFVFDNITKDILNKIKEKGKLKEDENGRYYVDLTEYNIPTKNPVLVITREDKTSLYPLRDLAYTIYKMNINSDNNFIVLGEDQEVYMKQIEAVLDILGYKAPKLISYSFVLLNGDKMATREGKVVLLEDFIEEAKRKIMDKINEKNLVFDGKISSMASSCIKYNMLNVSRKRNVNFNLEEATNFHGNSAMYILYNYARICSILEKSETNLEKVDLLKFKNDLEFSILFSLYSFPEIISNVVNSQESVVLTTYLYEVSQKFSKYYELIPILSEDDKIIKISKLTLLKAIKIVLENGMRVLGIEPINKI